MAETKTQADKPHYTGFASYLERLRTIDAYDRRMFDDIILKNLFGKLQELDNAIAALAESRDNAPPPYKEAFASFVEIFQTARTRLDAKAYYEYTQQLSNNTQNYQILNRRTRGNKMLSFCIGIPLAIFASVVILDASGYHNLGFFRQKAVWRGIEFSLTGSAFVLLFFILNAPRPNYKVYQAQKAMEEFFAHKHYVVQKIAMLKTLVTETTDQETTQLVKLAVVTEAGPAAQDPKDVARARLEDSLIPPSEEIDEEEEQEKSLIHVKAERVSKAIQTPTDSSLTPSEESQETILLNTTATNSTPRVKNQVFTLYISNRQFREAAAQQNARTQVDKLIKEVQRSLHSSPTETSSTTPQALLPTAEELPIAALEATYVVLKEEYAKLQTKWDNAHTPKPTGRCG